MTSSPAQTTNSPFAIRTQETLDMLESTGQTKVLQTLDSPMDATVTMIDADGSRHERICMCSNNYLGLANYPDVVDAGIEALKRTDAVPAPYCLRALIPASTTSGWLASPR